MAEHTCPTPSVVMRSVVTILASTGFFSLSCGGSTGPEETISASDVSELVGVLVEVGLVQWPEDSETLWACPDGGSVARTVSGSYGEGVFTEKGVLSYQACVAGTSSGSDFTFDGDLEVSDTWTLDNFGRVTDFAGTRDGSLSWRRGSALGTCELSLQLSGVISITLTGTACGRPVTRTVSGE